MIRAAAIAGVFTVLGLATACDESTSPLRQVTVEVDSAVYHLQQHPVSYSLDLTATVRNGSDRDVYLYRRCGYWHLARADGDTTSLTLGQYGCIEEDPVQPDIIPPGGEYVRLFHITGSNSPDTRPRITIANHIGTLALSYWISDAPDERKSKRVTSAPFRVEPPAGSSP